MGAAPTLWGTFIGTSTGCSSNGSVRYGYTTLATSFVSEPFTLAGLRRVYTAVWAQAPDLGNFRRQVLSTKGFVVEAQRSPAAVAGPAGGRPPQMYRRGDATVLHPPMLRPKEDRQS